jgi:hypothetical protein
MASNDEAERRRRPDFKAMILALVVAVSIIAAGWALVTVATTSQVPPTDFVILPTTPLSKQGEGAFFSSISSIGQKGVAVGVKGYLETISGMHVAGAKVYVTYYLRGEYRTQVTTTDQNGYFEMRFPMNWTGWLPITLTYFGDDQHKGITRALGLSGENL